jgi:autotransporter strand-loop-strand O-heptosyltransferase
MKDQLIQGYESTEILAVPSKEPIPQFNINFIQGAFFEILGGRQLDYDVSFIDNKTNQVIHSGKISPNCWIKASKQSFVDWKIKALDGIHEYEYNLDLKDKRVYIALDSKSLGDTLAWFPYIEEFQKKYNCKIITSTFWNHFFEKEYPNFEFAKPGETVNNLYAMYTIGWFYNEDGTIDYNKNPKDFKHIPLQQTASDILGLEYKELRPIEVLPCPVVILGDEESPTAVLYLPSVLATKAHLPMATNLQPIVFCLNAHIPTAVLAEAVL